MLVKKRYMVQKSFRLDQDVERDLAKLAEIVEKSQNELVNAAIVEMLQDNKFHFLGIAVYEHFMYEIEDGKEELSTFELGGLKVDISFSDSGKVLVRYIWTVDNEVAEDITKEFDSIGSDEFEDYLKRLGDFISESSDDSKDYIDRRMDYRDYIKVEK